MSSGFSMDNVTQWVAAQADILTNIANSLLPVERLITGSAYIIGLFFIFKSIQSFKTYGESRASAASNSNIREPFMYLLVGSIFIYFPSALSVFMNTTFGYASPLAYGPITSPNQTLSSLFGAGSNVGNSLTLVIQVIGLIAFIRGWILIARGGQGQQQGGGIGKGFVHVFGGILAINIVGTLEIINNTLYGT